MYKFLTRVLPAVILSGAMSVSCDDKDNGLVPEPEQPTFNVTVNDVQRAQATFTITTTDAADYAYVVVEKDADAVTDAKALFETGTVGQFEDGKAEITTTELEGDKEYMIYTAVRRINPYVYSNVEVTDLSTAIPYTDLVTLNKVGTRTVDYHVEFPEGADKVKHLVAKRHDFEDVKRLMSGLGEVTELGYLDTFGHVTTETIDHHAEDIEYNVMGDTYSHIHPGTPYLLLAGICNEKGRVTDEDKFQMIEFETRKAPECPYDIEVSITTTSTSANIVVKPAPEITEYRIVIGTREEFYYDCSGDKVKERNLVIGYWNDSKNSPKRVYKGNNEFNMSGLVPAKEHIVAIVGFDDLGREKYIYQEFVTGNPVGPKPELTVTEVEPEVIAPWSTKAFQVKTTYAAELRAGFFLKRSIDQLLNNGSTLASILVNNAPTCSADQVAQSMTEDGVVFETNDLQPMTEYVFAVYVRNEEYVNAVESIAFTTEELPKVGGAMRKNMPGKYIATTTVVDDDDNETTVSFPVTITTGPDATASAQYDGQNRLVALGFGPAEEFPVKTPADLIAEGADTDDAYRNYGPKWFIEFASDTECYVPKARESKQTGSYLWTMGQINGKDVYMMGIGVHPKNGRDLTAYAEQFPIEVSADGKTVTVKGVVETSGSTYYPFMGIPGSWSSTIYFRCWSDLVLTKQDDAESKAFVGKKLSLPKVINLSSVNTSEALKANLNAIADKLK